MCINQLMNTQSKHYAYSCFSFSLSSGRHYKVMETSEITLNHPWLNLKAICDSSILENTRGFSLCSSCYITLQCLPEENLEEKQLYAYKLGWAGMTESYYTHSLCNLAQLFPPVDRSLPDRERGDSCWEEKEKVKEMFSSANLWHKNSCKVLNQLVARKNTIHSCPCTAYVVYRFSNDNWTYRWSERIFRGRPYFQGPYACTYLASHSPICLCLPDWVWLKAMDFLIGSHGEFWEVITQDRTAGFV